MATYRVHNEEEETALVHSFCSALLRSRKVIGWKNLTLGLFASYTVDQRVVKATTSTLSSLTELALEEVDKMFSRH